MTEAIGGPVARIGQEARDYSRQFSSRFNPGVTSSGRRSPFVRIAVGFPRSCIIRLGIARRAFKRGKPWKRVACTSYAPHAPLHTRSNSLSNSASSVTFLPFFLFPILNARPLPLSLSLSLACSVCTRHRASMLDVFHVFEKQRFASMDVRFLRERRSSVENFRNEKF